MSDLLGAIHEIEALCFVERQFIEAVAGHSGPERSEALRRALAIADLLADRADDLARYCAKGGLADDEELAELKQDLAASALRVAQLEQEQVEAREVLRKYGLPITGNGLVHDVREGLEIARLAAMRGGE